MTIPSSRHAFQTSMTKLADGLARAYVTAQSLTDASPEDPEIELLRSAVWEVVHAYVEVAREVRAGRGRR